MKTEEHRLMDKDEMDDTEESKESPKKEQQIIFIFSQQVTNDKIFQNLTAFSLRRDQV